MRTPRRSSLAVALGLWVVLSSTAVSRAAEPPLQAAFEGSSIVAWPVLDGARIELDASPSSGSQGSGLDSRTIKLPRGAQLDSLRGRPGGFFLAGSAPTKDGGQRLFLMAGDPEGTLVLPALARSGAAIRCQPVLLTEAGGLVGLAWMEGETMDSLGVRAARWNGHAWSRAERVAGSGPGGQLALTGAVLADGSWLLAWSRYDGQDDEIAWSQRLGDDWSEPKSVSADNAVPDIVPALSASGTGALLAWSRYDGNDYRLMTARFAAGEWGSERTAGPAGSLFPSFPNGGALGKGATTLLLYRTAQPRGWTLAELEPEGGVVRQAKVTSPGTARPAVLVARDGAGARFRWPGRKKADHVATWSVEELP